MHVMVWFMAVTCVAIAALSFLIAPTGGQLLYVLAAGVSLAAGAVVALGHDAAVLVLFCTLLAAATLAGSYAARVVRRRRHRMF